MMSMVQLVAVARLTGRARDATQECATDHPHVRPRSHVLARLNNRAISDQPRNVGFDLVPSRLVDDALYRRARTARAGIESGALRGPALVDQLTRVPFRDRDVWIDEALGIAPPPPDIPELPRGSVPYLPCGVDEILALVREVPLGTRDTLVDLGSGLGRVVILAHLLSGVRAHGIELQEPLVRAARSRADELGLDAVTFTHGSVADDAVPLAGTVFFLYAPCNGAMLARVLERLAAVAPRPIVCAVDVEVTLPWPTSQRISAGLTIYEPAASR